MNTLENKSPLWVVSVGAACAVVLIVLIAVVGNGISGNARAAGSRPPTGPTTTATTPALSTTAPLPALGVYAGPGAPAAVATFSSAVGTPTTYALDYIDGSSWQTIADPDWILSKWTGSGYHMIFAVPMLAPGATLVQGASGTFNANFQQLAANLVREGFASSWLIIGADPNATTALWHVDSSVSASDYVSYWQQIVKTMRSVPGQSFHFVWDTTPLANGVTPEEVYPGNNSVDVIATDAFEDDPLAASADRWPGLVNGLYGLNWFANFASHEGKPLMVAKWGVVPSSEPGGSGDDPTFVRQLLAWSSQNKVAVLVTWNYGSWAITGGEFPQSLATFRSALTGGAR